MPVDQNHFQALFAKLSAIDLFGVAGPEVPFAIPPSVDGVGPAIQEGLPFLPPEFAVAYGQPFEEQLGSLLARLNQAGDVLLIETLAGAIYQLSPNSLGPPLRRFLAVISDLYRSFLSKKRRAAAGFPILETLPPLAMFQRNGSSGPFTVPCDQVQQLVHSNVGVVSLPATYSQHPLLWASLAHETGGHDVTHADEALLPELMEGVQAFLGGGPVSPGGPMTDAQLMGLLWSYWMDEATADVYGVLNVGPEFGLNLVAFFAALNAQAGDGHNVPQLRTLSGFDPTDPGQRLDDHPTDILRPYLILGATEALQNLQQSTRAAYAADLKLLAKICAPDATMVTIAGVLQAGPGMRIPVTRQFPLVQMQAVARSVGAFIATAKLAALDGHSIQDIETWDDADERTARRVSEALQNNASVVDQGDDAQLLAGATLAAFINPEAYDQITKRLEEALDASFAKDPIWGVPRRDAAILRVMSTQLPMDFGAASKICQDCIRATSHFQGEIRGQDTMTNLGIKDQPAITSLVDRLLSTEIGVPSAGFVINPDSIVVQSSTTFSQLKQLLVDKSRPAL